MKNLVNNDLTVDNWIIKCEDNEAEDIIEIFDGRIPIEQTDKQKYLGYYLSNKGDNMINIKELKKKSI